MLLQTLPVPISRRTAPAGANAQASPYAAPGSTTEKMAPVPGEEPAAPPSPVVYQLRVVLAGVSPLVWRRLLVTGDTSIAELHAILQAAFGWSDEHLHRSTIHGVEYGLWRPGTAGFSHDARKVRLSGFGFRVGERFSYEYDFYDAWRHDIRVEKILSPACRVSPPTS